MAEHSSSNPSRPRPGDRLADLVVSAEPIHDAPPTPPYRQYAASISDDIQSPPYRSRSQVQLVDGSDDKSGLSERTSERDMVDVKHQPTETSSGKGHDTHDDEHRQAKGVHYPEDIPRIEKPVKFDSTTDLPSRAASTVPSEDEHNLDKADDNDYDWSTDDDEVDEEAKKFEQRVDGSKERSLFLRIISFFLSTLVGSALTAAALVGAALAVHFLYYENSNDDDRSHRKYVNDNVEAWLFWAAANLLVSWFLALIVNIVPGVVTWAIFIVWGHISESMKSKVEFYNAIKDTIKPIFYAASGWLSWVIIFANIYDLYDKDDPDSSRANYTSRLFQVIEFCFFFILILCLQRVLSQLIAFSFHKTAFKDRLDELSKKLKTIEHLKKYKPRHRTGRSSGLFSGFAPALPSLAPSLRPFGGRSTATTPGEEKAHFLSSGTGTRVGSPVSRKGTPDLYDDGNAGDSEDNSPNSSKKGKGKAKTARQREIPTPIESRPDSPAPGKLYTNTHPEHLYPPPTSSSPSPRPSRKNSESEDDNAVLQVGKEAGKAIKKAVLHDARNMTGKEDTEIAGLGWAVGSNEEARRLARSIYEAFKTDRRRRYLIVDDFYPAYPNHDEALEAFRVFDVDHNGDISRAEIKSTIVQTYRERRFLSRSMRDVGLAMHSLDRVLLIFAFIIILFISLSVFGVDFSSSLTSVYTVGIAASFIFKTTCTRIFDSIMFLFVTHPFDTGDRCFIDDENLVVKKMGLLATVFQRADGTETYYFNSQLFTKFITNARRSDKTGELCTLFIAWNTPLSKIDELEKRVNSWLAVEENRWFQPQTSVVFQQVVNQNYIEIALGIPHNNNWQDWGLRNQVKTTFYAAVNYYCRQLDITYASSPMPLIWAAAEEEAQQKSDLSPTTSSFRENAQPDEESAAAAKNMRPMLGFLPPLERRDAHLLKARKSKYSKNHAMRAMDGG